MHADIRNVAAVSRRIVAADRVEPQDEELTVAFRRPVDGLFVVLDEKSNKQLVASKGFSQLSSHRIVSFSRSANQQRPPVTRADTASRPDECSFDNATGQKF